MAGDATMPGEAVGGDKEGATRQAVSSAVSAHALLMQLH